ncbi:hypothetical protein D3OALGA1CA_4640 [Olavius algarvensis associated proteobacterium Delta 3]|nr:hypothetical protein D3OALGB2SA_4829 [Olavius algarvensis associated proteobacterium Delta 3]CAB5154594.1 hypothetical protein D3OALGA1CA_4640 [Olavius algarvensis associated proteobacterium Delta 3]
MNIVFQRRVYQVPDVRPLRGEIAISPEKIAVIPTPGNPTEKMFRFDFPIRKLIFFFYREGIRLTLKKIQGSSLTRTILSEQQVVFAYGRTDDGRYAIGIGPQPCTKATRYLFPSSCTMAVEKNRNIDADLMAIFNFFQRFPGKLAALADYSPYSDNPLELDLTHLITGGRAGNALPREPSYPSIVSVHEALTGPVRDGPKALTQADAPDLFLAGAGVYAFTYILPSLAGMRFHTVMDRNPALACAVGEKFAFKKWETSCERGLEHLRNARSPRLVVATYHSTHVSIAEQALRINPETKIIIEKPPVTTIDQLKRLVRLRQANRFVEVGYNRRYAPMMRKAREILSRHSGPITMTCVVREKHGIPLSHWYYWPAQGTRITGNLSHWIDLGIWFIPSNPVAVSCLTGSKTYPADEPVITVLFDDGSLLTIVGSDRGNALRGIQEYIDVRRGDLTLKIDDLLRMEVLEKGYRRVYRRRIRDKGHSRMYRAFKRSCETGDMPLYAVRDLIYSSKLYLDIKDVALSDGRYVELTDYNAFLEGCPDE